MNRKIIWVLLILIVLGAGYYLLKPKVNNSDYSNLGGNNVSITTATSTDSTITASTTTSTSKNYTLTDVAGHSSSTSCWAAIEGKVYDLTSWIGQHPGGADKILSICGKDGTQAFDGKHGMDPRAKGVLPNFYLGVLVN